MYLSKENFKFSSLTRYFFLTRRNWKEEIETDFLRIFTTGKSDILLVWKLKHCYKIIIRVNSVHLQWSFHNRLNFSHIFQPNKLERRLKGET